MSDDESKRVQAALLRAVASGARTRRALSGAVRGRSGNAAYQRARKLGLVGGRAAPAGTGPVAVPGRAQGPGGGAVAHGARRRGHDGPGLGCGKARAGDRGGRGRGARVD